MHQDLADVHVYDEKISQVECIFFVLPFIYLLGLGMYVLWFFHFFANALQ